MDLTEGHVPGRCPDDIQTLLFEASLVGSSCFSCFQKDILYEWIYTLMDISWEHLHFNHAVMESALVKQNSVESHRIHGTGVFTYIYHKHQGIPFIPWILQLNPWPHLRGFIFKSLKFSSWTSQDNKMEEWKSIPQHEYNIIYIYMNLPYFQEILQLSWLLRSMFLWLLQSIFQWVRTFRDIQSVVSQNRLCRMILWDPFFETTALPLWSWLEFMSHA